MKALALPVAALFLVNLWAVGAEAQSNPPAWSKDDPVDDFVVRYGAQSTPGMPALPGEESLDVTGLMIDDRDGERLEFILKTKAPIAIERPAGGERSPLGTIRILFQAPGASVVGEASVFLDYVAEGAARKSYVSGAWVCAREERIPYCGGESSRVMVEKTEDGALLLGVPKSAFVLDESRFRPLKSLPARLNAGDELSKIRIRSLPYLAGPSSFQPGREDVAPNTGDWPNYRLRFASSLPNLKLNTTSVGVLAGEESIVPVGLKNLGDRKRLINLSAEIDGSETPGWKVSVTPLVTVAAKNETTIMLRVGAPAIEAGSTKATVRIRAIVMTEGGDSASLTLQFFASPVLDRGSSKFFFHSESNSANGALGPVADTLSEMSGSFRGALSRAENDAGYPDQFGLAFWGSATGSVRVFGVQSEAFPNPVRAIPGAPLTARLSVDSPFSIAGKLRLGIAQGFNLQPLASLEKEVSLVAGKNDIDLQGSFLKSVDRLPSGARLYTDVEFQSDSPLMAAWGFYGMYRLKLLPKLSWFEMPIQRDLEQELIVKGPRVVLAPSEDVADFIYPGRNRIFEMDLRNEEPQAHRVEVAYENVTPGWTLDVLPGSRFLLKANESAHIGIRVIAPASAREGNVMAPRIFVRGTESGEVYHGLRLNLTVTSGIEDLENETFSVSVEDKGKLEGLPKGSSPSLSVVGIIAMLGLAVLGVRRRGRSD